MVPPGSILILVSSTQRRGAEVFGEHLARALKETGRSTNLLSLHQVSPGAGVGAAPLFEASEINGISGLRLRVVRRLRSAIAELQPVLVLAGGGATLKYSVAALVGMRDGPSLVYSSIGEPEFWARSWWRKKMMSALLSRTRLVTAVSQATADQLVRSFGVNPAKIRVVHPGVPDDYLDIDGREANPGRLRILYLGSMSEEKDPLAAVAAVSLMESSATLRMVGDGPLIGRLEEESRVAAFPMEVAGPADNVRDHLRWADVLILTSRTEGLPGVILEAGAAGVPVAAFDVGGVTEAVVEGVTGLVMPPGDQHAMAQALDRLARDPSLRSTMARAAKERIRGHFLLSHALDRYRAVLDELLGT